MIPFYFQSQDSTGRWRMDSNGDHFFAVEPTEHALSDGSQSAVIAAEWVRWGARWGQVTFTKIAALDGAGNHLGDADLTQDWWQIPDKARTITIEGTRSTDGSSGPLGMPGARLIPKARTA